MSKFSACSAVIVLAMGASSAFAQQAAPAPTPPNAAQTVPFAPDPATVQIAPPACEQPSAKPPKIRAGSDSQERDIKQRNKWQKSLSDYQKCMTAWWNDLNDRAKSYQNLAIRLNGEYINAVKSYNAFTDEVKKNEDAEDN